MRLRLVGYDSRRWKSSKTLNIIIKFPGPFFEPQNHSFGRDMLEIGGLGLG